MSTHKYTSGDKVRILTDEPYATELMAGDIVTVLYPAVKLEDDGSETPVVFVSTNHGRRQLELDVIELATPAYTPAEPDSEIDAAFTAMVEADPELTTIASVADTALGAEEERVSALLTVEIDEDDEDADEDDSPISGFKQPGPGNSFSATDYADDVLDVYYAEQDCEEHGRESIVVVQINDNDAVVIPLIYVESLISFLLGRIRFSRRPGDGTVQP